MISNKALTKILAYTSLCLLASIGYWIYIGKTKAIGEAIATVIAFVILIIILKLEPKK